MTSKLIWQRSHKGTMKNKEAAIAHYNQHIKEVKALVPPDKLLIFNVREGWSPLCNFLGTDIPDTPFPNVNDRKQIKKTIADITKGAYFFLAIGIALLVMIAFLIYKFVI